MKKGIHPENFRPVIFADTASGERFLILSTVKTDKTDKWTDGKKYSMKQIEISSASHPFYTGKNTMVDTAGRVEKFKAKMAKAQSGLKSKTLKKAEKKARKEAPSKVSKPGAEKEKSKK